MRVAFVVTLFLIPAIFPAIAQGDGPERAGPACGRAGYPSETVYNAAAVANGTLWQTFRDEGGFTGGNETTGAVEVRLQQGGTVHVASVREASVRTYVGGTETDRTTLVLSIRDETSGGQAIASYDFAPIDLGGRSGGNLTIVERAPASGLDVFWRWAYLLCGDDVVNAYYVFHARIADGQVRDGNTLVYFEAPRPNRGPPADLFLLVGAGIGVTAVFLLARRALKKRA
ncbi:MAG: hypothetical protein E6K18_07405 [Methanobacteriota archaeon]|nr:MAG: hypothetical protein E6K18_07405 [Euryarchaeota archaeon]